MSRIDGLDKVTYLSKKHCLHNLFLVEKSTPRMRVASQLLHRVSHMSQAQEFSVMPGLGGGHL